MMKNILVVDDSALMRRVLCDIISSESNFQVADTCCDGLEAYEKLKANTYDGVLLDVNMPRMDGLQLLERLQKENIKANIIMVSTLTTRDAQVTMLALERGAIDFVAKPGNIIEAKSEEFKKQLLSVLLAVLTTKKMAKEHKPRQLKDQGNRTEAVSLGVSPRDARELDTSVKRLPRKKDPKNRLVALACSTGGPKALQEVIPFLAKNMDAPMILVQHMPVGFTKSMAERLNSISKVTVKEAEEGDLLEKGHVYVAPGGKHMEVTKNPDGSHRVRLTDMPPIGGLRPCANVTFDSLKQTGYDDIVCVVLTGMGADGTNGILSLCRYKPVHVIAQEAKSCVVYGMPKAIAETGMVDEMVALKDVAETIIKMWG